MAEFITGMGWYVVPFIFVLSVLVFIHELGHFLVARLNKVGVTDFSIGFGPEIFGWLDSKGTRWKFCWIPLGGYVKMIGDADPSSLPDTQKLKLMDEDLKKHSLFYKSVWQRIAVSVAGPAANYLFAIIVFSFMYMSVGQRYTAPVVKEVLPDGAAYVAGVQAGDKFLSIDEQTINRFEDVQAIVHSSPDVPLKVVVQRGHDNVDLKITPKLSVINDIFGNEHRVGLLGVAGGQAEYVIRPWYSAWWYATMETVTLSLNTLEALGDVITGVKSADGLGGPLRIAQMSGDFAQNGVVALIWFMALLSVNLGLINLFPIPMLDGGHLLFYFIEVVTGRSVPPRAQEWAFRIGFLLIVTLMIWATWNDVSHIANK